MEIAIIVWRLSITLNIVRKSTVSDMDFYFYFHINWGYRRIFMLAFVKDYHIYLQRKALSLSVGILKYFRIRYITLKKG